MIRLAVLIFIILCRVLPAQEHQNKYGAFIHYGINFHLPNFKKLPGVPNCCPNFSRGNGSGVSAGLLLEMPLSPTVFASLRAGYYYLGGRLEDKDNTSVLISDELTAGEFMHVIDTDISAVGLEPLISAELYNNFFLLVGTNIGLYSGGSFSQFESLSKPENTGVFADTKTRRRNDTSGTIPQMNLFALSFEFGLSYHFYLNRNRSLIASPEIFYSFGLNDIARFAPWRVNTLRMGIALKYSHIGPIQIREEIKQELRIDTIRILSRSIGKDMFAPGYPVFVDKRDELNNNYRIITEVYARTDTVFLAGRPKMAEGIKEYRVFSYGRAADSNSIFIRSQFVTQAFPLLPFVYFEKNSGEIPERYKKLPQGDDFKINELDVNPVNYHHNILNIVGKRLTEYPHTKITLEGFADAFTEEGDCRLAASRAEAVKGYFIAVWNINPQRIEIKISAKKCSPPDYTRTPNEYGYSENRRVRINSEDKEILSPIDKKRYLEFLAISPAVLAHKIEADNPENIAEWFISASQEGFPHVISEAGMGKPGIIENQITEAIAARLASGKPLRFSLRIRYKDESLHESGFEIPVRHDTSDIEVERLSLAIFNVSANTLRDVDKKAIETFLGELKPADTLGVAGYTDMLGDPDENSALSQRRADIVCNQIVDIFGRLGRAIDISKCRGVGFAFKPPQIRSYELPEERFLSRTVQIEIRRRWR
mgnify:CR=1 FL=1